MYEALWYYQVTLEKYFRSGQSAMDEYNETYGALWEDCIQNDPNCLSYKNSTAHSKNDLIYEYVNYYFSDTDTCLFMLALFHYVKTLLC